MNDKMRGVMNKKITGESEGESTSQIHNDIYIELPPAHLTVTLTYVTANKKRNLINLHIPIFVLSYFSP